VALFESAQETLKASGFQVTNYIPQPARAIRELPGLQAVKLQVQGQCDESKLIACLAGLRAGQTHNGGTIRQIGPDWVEMELAGKITRVQVFGGSPASAPSGPPPAPPGAVRVPHTGAINAAQVAQQFQRMSPQARRKILERMPPEIRTEVEKLLNEPRQDGHR